LQPDAPLRRLEALSERLTRQFPRNDVDDIVDDAYRAGASTFTAKAEVPDELVPAALAACDALDAMIEELDRWTEDPEVRLLPPPADVRAYRVAYLDQAREQLRSWSERNGDGTAQSGR
jgi:hypothetical protein